jgi:signal transduction histidine kinase
MHVSGGAGTSERLWRALLDDAKDGLLAVDENGVVLEVNEAAARRLGRSVEHLRGKPLPAVVPLDDRRMLRHAIASVGVDPIVIELRLGDTKKRTKLVLRVLPGIGRRTISARLPAGRVVATPVSAPPIRLELDRIFRRFPSGVIGIWRDDLRIAFVNPRARQLLDSPLVIGAPLLADGLPADIRKLVERLVTLKVPIRATRVELADGRALRISGVPGLATEPALLTIDDVTEQERHERVMRDFLRNAAHQLRTPLTAMTTAVQVLQSGAKDDPGERERFLEHIEQHVDRMTRVTRGLLVLARAQSREQAMRLDFVELRPLFDRLAARADAPDGVTIEASCSPSLAVFAEQDLVEEALAALVENALANTHNGTVRLTATEENGRAWIEVTDSGSGILPEHRERIFEPFYRGSSSGDGFGLGLAIASQAVRAMDGELHVADAPEGGTTFRVRLPSARVRA